jgi:hypothetical protein
MFLGKEKYLAGQLSPFGTSCSLSFREGKTLKEKALGFGQMAQNPDLSFKGH